MKKTIYILFALMFTFAISKAQPVMQISGNDCNGVPHDLFADLDAGKAVLLHFFMTCASCPPPAQKIQAMANNILATHPGMITAYALGYTNSYSCATVANWVSNNGLSLYAPYDSGAAQVANYGGFGMPTVVLLGGAAPSRRVMFSTLSFSTSDTTIMRDSILALLNSATGINDLPDAVSSFSVYPNPASNSISVNFSLTESSIILIDVIDITGKQIAIISEEKQNGVVRKQFSTASLPNGNYLVRIQVNGKTAMQKLTIIH
jgi:hypothetical protein